MKRNTKTRSKPNRQKGAVNNWLRGLSQPGAKKLKIIFIIAIAVFGSYLVFVALAASKPKYFGNALYWIDRVRTCETSNGLWGNGDYSRKGGAFNYSTKLWNNYGGYADASSAPSNVQDQKFISDWNNSKIGSNPWKKSMECWKPAGTIKGAPCLPVPKNPVKDGEDVNTELPVVEEGDAIDEHIIEHLGHDDCCDDSEDGSWGPNAPLISESEDSE